jgi:hypothetical protein
VSVAGATLSCGRYGHAPTGPREDMVHVRSAVGPLPLAFGRVRRRRRRPGRSIDERSRDPTVPAPSRPTARTHPHQRGSALAQLALLLASIGVIALAVLQVVRH